MLNPPIASIVFFPGVVFHELSHYLACLLTGVTVKSVKWFGTTEAFVVHELPNAWQSIVISLAPFLLGSALGFELFFAASQIWDASIALSLFYGWLALSLLLFAFPSLPDASNALQSILAFYNSAVLGKGKRWWARIAWLATFPFVFIPVTTLLALLLLFNYVTPLRWFWAAFMLSLAWDPGALATMLNALLA